MLAIVDVWLSKLILLCGKYTLWFLFCSGMNPFRDSGYYSFKCSQIFNILLSFFTECVLLPCRHRINLFLRAIVKVKLMLVVENERLEIIHMKRLSK